MSLLASIVFVASFHSSPENCIKCRTQVNKLVRCLNYCLPDGTWVLRYVWFFAIANSSVVCNVHAPYSGSWNFRQYLFAILYLSHPSTFVQILRRSSQGKPSVVDVKCKRGSKIERCHVPVSHLLMSFLYTALYAAWATDGKLWTK